MALWMDGFDFYDDETSGTEMGSFYSGTGGTLSAVGSGAYAYGRSWSSNTTGTFTYAFPSNWATVYMGFHLKTGTSEFGVSGVEGITLYDGTTSQCSIRLNSTGHFLVYQSTTLKATATTPLAALDTWYWVAIKVIVHGSTGAVVINVNGVEYLNATGLDLTGTANNYATKVQFKTFGNNSTYSQIFDNLHLYDGGDAAPYNDLLAEHRIYYNLPDGDGGDTAWTASSGNRWACVDENPPTEDTDYISDATVGHQNSFTVPDFDTDLVVHAVSLTIQARKDDATSRGIKSFVNISSTRYYSAEFALSSTYVMYTKQWLVSPATSSAWTVSEINGAEWGVEVTT